MATSIVGIDIGKDAVRAVELADPSKPRPTLLRYHEVALPEGAVGRGEVIESNTVAEALKQLWKAGGFTSRKVVLGVGNQRVFARDLTVPKMSLKRIRESLPFQVQEMLPVPVAEALLDFYPVSQGESDQGPVVHGLLIAAVKDAVLSNVKAASLAGLTAVDVDLIPFALSRALVSRPGLTGSVVLIDIGANTTSVVVATDGVPQFVRIIPTGGDDVTQALRSELEIEVRQAEDLKQALGMATQVKDVGEQRAVEIIYRVTGELLNSLRNTISYFTNTRPNDPVQQIVLTGGGSKMVGLANALAQLTQLRVVAGDPFASIGVSRKLHADDLRRNGIALSVALGLALGSAA